jgi:hypothetical protein
MSDRKGSQLEDEASLNISNQIIQLSKIRIDTISFNFNWMKEIIEYQEKTK